jgi:hypothetical protein
MNEMKKVTKAQVKAMARKNGTVDVMLFPSNCGPANTTWIRPFDIKVCSTPDQEGFYVPSAFDHEDHDFESIVDWYAVFNCDAEVGKRVHYYVQEGK